MRFWKRVYAGMAIVLLLGALQPILDVEAQKSLEYRAAILAQNTQWVAPDNSLSYGTATGSVVDDSDWPQSVKISIKNNQAFWLGVDLVSSTGGASILSRDDFGAKVGYIPPDSTATYTVKFNDKLSSDLSFFVDGSLANNPGGLQTGRGGFYISGPVAILEFFALWVGLGGVFEDVFATFAKVNWDQFVQLADLFANSVTCGFGIAEASKENLWNAAKAIGECIFSSSIIDAVVTILTIMGVPDPGVTRRKITGMHIAGAWAIAEFGWKLARMFYGTVVAGAYGGNINFESSADTRGTVVVSHVDKGGVALPGGCFTLYRQAPESSGRGGRQNGACDGDDGERDGTTTIRSPQGNLILAETTSPAGYRLSP